MGLNDVTSALAQHNLTNNNNLVLIHTISCCNHFMMNDLSK